MKRFKLQIMLRRNGRIGWHTIGDLECSGDNSYSSPRGNHKVFMSPVARAQCLMPELRHGPQWRLA